MNWFRFDNKLFSVTRVTPNQEDNGSTISLYDNSKKPNAGAESDQKLMK